LDNLVNNAFNYTHPNGQITVHLHIEGNEAQIDVKDNGIGIPPEDSKRIFERFYRGEDPLVLATSGNGLGLPITQQLVEMHHGRIWMKSNGVPGDGSVFSFTLPLQNWYEN
jgi:two-component system phosphate regulon sensor histidine kinase PhoR